MAFSPRPPRPRPRHAAVGSVCGADAGDLDQEGADHKGEGTGQEVRAKAIAQDGAKAACVLYALAKAFMTELSCQVFLLFISRQQVRIQRSVMSDFI